MSGSTGVRGTPHEIALLGGGPRAAVTVAVVALHLRGAVEAGAPGTLRAVDGEAGRALPALPPPGTPLDVWPADGPGPAEPVTGARRALYLESAVYSCLGEPSEVRELVRHPDVRWAVAEVRVGLAEAGLLRYPLLGPTRAARRRLRVLRKACPVPASRRGLPDHDKLLAVALHGETALRVLVPRFALRAGLTGRVAVTDRGMLRHSPRGGIYGGGGSSSSYYCGGGGGGGGD
ncbi:TIGR04222 domain-containing membrane protein [Streptomyces sp.]|uniref:TIGR04222 domain-containing membrane protein n=1 Tax=Streptomyces sp. TaxID=1931 RepID=UPI00281217E2|nr:TIGR04222 domain-containing membrane protein [Streptomyces sp.]